MTTLSERFHELFLGLERAHGYWKNGAKDAHGKVKGEAKTLQKPITDDLWAKHLSGSIGLGVVPVNDEGLCIWGAIDIDIYDGLDHEGLENQISAAEIPLVVVRSKSGGAHLYMFTSAPVKARLIQQRLKECAMSLGHPSAEVFPKQIVLDGENGIGNWINMPYQSAKTTVRYAIKNGLALNEEEFLEFAESKKIDPQALQDLKPRVGGSDEWCEGPPCLQYLVANGFPVGSKNNALFNLAVYAKKKYGGDAWQEYVAKYNERWMNGTFSEVTNIIRSLSKNVNYKYKCGDVPVCNHCNKVECYNRPYGVTDGENKKRVGRPSPGENAPCVLEEVDRPVKVFRPQDESSDEPHWIFTISGKRMDVTLDMLLDQRKFLREFTRCFERLRLMVPETRWQESVNDLLSGAEVLDLPTDAGPEGQLMQHLESFCTGKVSAADMSELLLGRPWTDDLGVTWFRSKDFMAYMDRIHFREFRQAELYPVFRRHGAKNHNFMIKGTCVAAWGIPSFKTQDEPLDPIVVQRKEEVF